MKTLNSQIIKTLLASLLCLPSLLAAQTEVASYRPGVTTEGITYFLPRTQLHIVVRAERESYTPGEYAAFAQRFLGKEKVVLHPADNWTLKAIEVVPFGVADREKAYTIKLNHKTSAPLVSLAPDGRLLGVNRQAAPLPNLEMASITPHGSQKPDAHRFKTQEILRAGSLSAKAEITAQELYDIRENRNLLAKGQAEFNPKDGEQLRLMLARLDEQEAALTSLFLGTKTYESHVFTFVYSPDANVDREEIFRFSKHLGLVDKDDLAGNPIYISIEDKKTLPHEEENPKEKNKKQEEGLRYCNPGNAVVKIFNGQRTFYENILPISQFGRIEYLGGILFNKKYNIHVTLSPTTGRIERLDLEQLPQ